MINTDIPNQIPGEQRIYHSYDKIICDNDINNYPVEFLNPLTISGLPPHKIVLKVNLHRFADQKIKYKGSISQWNQNEHQIYAS